MFKTEAYIVQLNRLSLRASLVDKSITVLSILSNEEVAALHKCGKIRTQ